MAIRHITQQEIKNDTKTIKFITYKYSYSLYCRSSILTCGTSTNCIQNLNLFNFFCYSNLTGSWSQAATVPNPPVPIHCCMDKYNYKIRIKKCSNDLKLTGQMVNSILIKKLKHCNYKWVLYRDYY